MGTSAIETTPTGSLAEAAVAFGKLRSHESEERTTPKAQPEQREDDTARPDATQAPATVQAESESDEQADAAQTPAPKTYKVKVAGEELEVAEEELLKSYSREQDYTRKMQEVAEQRRQVEAAKDTEIRQLSAQRQEYAEYLGKMKALVNPVEPDPTKLSPEEFHVRYAEYKEAKQALEKIEAEQKRMKDLDAAEAEEGFKKHVHGEYQKLVEAIPEFGDTAKAEPLRKELGVFATSLGFSEQDLEHVTDHRLVKLLHLAMTGERAIKAQKEKAPEIKSKIAKVLESPAPGGRQDTSPKNDVLKAQERLSKTGRVEDAASVFGAIRKREAASR